MSFSRLVVLCIYILLGLGIAAALISLAAAAICLGMGGIVHLVQRIRNRT